MKKNIGSIDRFIRFTISILLGGLAIWQNSWILGLLALFTLYEALASWCILYQILGKNSCSIPKKK